MDKSQGEDCHGIFINCFDDPAVISARETSLKPVLGPYLPTVKMASVLSEKIAVITTDSYGILCEERKARAHMVHNLIGDIVAMDVGVLELPDCDLAGNLVDICIGLEKKNIFAAVLGCTGMFFAAEQAQQKLDEMNINVQIVEPFKTGIGFLETMIRLGYGNKIKCHVPCL